MMGGPLQWRECATYKKEQKIYNLFDRVTRAEHSFQGSEGALQWTYARSLKRVRRPRMK
jgi:hypothetical protein